MFDYPCAGRGSELPAPLWIGQQRIDRLGQSLRILDRN